MGMSALPATVANAAPDNAATTPAPTVPVVAQATDPVVTAAPGQTENVVPNQPTTGNTLPGDNPVTTAIIIGGWAGHAWRAGSQCAGGCRKYAVA